MSESVSDRALRLSNAKNVRLYSDKKSTELGEIKKKKNEGTILLLCLTSTLQPV